MNDISDINDTSVWTVKPVALCYDYSLLLNHFGFEFTEQGVYYKVGEIITEEWEVFVSIVAFETTRLLEVILPFLKERGIAFRLIQRRDHQYRLNNGEYGIVHVGKVMLFYPQNEKEAGEFTTWLMGMTEGNRGPALSNNPRLSNVIYAANKSPFIKKKPFTKRIVPALRKITGIKKKPVLVFRIKKVIGKHYRPRVRLRFSPKGEIYKGINTQKLSWVVIKRGRFCAFEDDHGRTIQDRLKWQAHLSEYLPDDVPIQRAIAYIEDGEDTYLILEWIEGETVGEAVRAINPKKLPWKDLNVIQKSGLKKLILNSLVALTKLHGAGIVHRDLTEGNLLVDKRGKIWFIDMEMAADVFRHLPNPVFYPGASQFRAPEQGELPVGGFEEDIFSFGCLLSWMFTSWMFRNFSKTSLDDVLSKLEETTEDLVLTQLVLDCTDKDAQKRPSIGQLIERITNYNLSQN